MKAVNSLLRVFVELHPEDAARAFESLNAAEAARLLKSLPMRELAELFEQFSPHLGAMFFDQLPPERRQQLLEELTPRSASNLLQQIQEPQRDEVLESLPERKSAQLRALFEYPAETAGGLMEPRVVSLPIDLTAQQAITTIRKSPREALHYLYVTKRSGELVGVINMRDLLLAAPRDRIEPLVRRNVLTVSPSMDREDLVNRMRETGFLALPVVDDDGRLIGVVKHQEALEAGQLEAFEDLQRMVGAGSDEQALSPVTTVVKRRLPWLFVNLGTAFLAAAVVGLFEDVIQQVAALAVLLPVVAGQGGNTGSQSLAIVMRGLALREIVPGNRKRLLLKEAAGGLLNGIATAAVTAGCVFLWRSNVGLSLVIGLSMIVNMVTAALSGAAIPLVLRALGRDPAQSASIFLTTVTDVVGFGSFLGFAVLFISMLQ